MSGLRMLIAMAFLALVVTAPAAGKDASELQQEYYESLADYYEIETDQVVGLAKSGIVDEELPVVLTICQGAKASISTIRDVRLQGDSWMSIFKVRSIDPGIFFMLIVGEIDSDTYGPILAKFNGNTPYTWKDLDWTDSDLINMANLKFVGGQHDYSVYEVMAMRDRGRSFIQVNHDARLAKQLLIEEAEKRQVDSDAATAVQEEK